MKIFARILGIAMVAVALPLSSANANYYFSATMTGANENPANASTATGSALVTLHGDLNTLDVLMTFAGLTVLGSASHIHCCALPGVNAPVRLDFTGAGFPTGVLSGTYSHTFLLNTITLGGGMSTADFITGLFAGLAYTNIHDARYPGGEIRGQLVRVPEPASLAIFGLGLAGLGFVTRKRLPQGR